MSADDFCAIASDYLLVIVIVTVIVTVTVTPAVRFSLSIYNKRPYSSCGTFANHDLVPSLILDLGRPPLTHIERLSFIPFHLRLLTRSSLSSGFQRLFLFINFG